MTDLTPMNLVCAGRREMDGKLYLDMRLAERPTNPTRFPTKQTNRDYRPGAIYRLNAKIGDDGELSTVAFKPGYETFVKQYPEKELVGLWRLEHDAAESAARRRKLNAKTNGIDEAIAVLEPIRRAWRKTDSYGRRAIEATILDYLRG